MLVVNVMNYNLKSKKAVICDKIAKWSEHNKYILSRWDSLIDDLKIVRSDFIMYSVAVRSLLDLAKSSLSGLSS